MAKIILLFVWLLYDYVLNLKIIILHGAFIGFFLRTAKNSIIRKKNLKKRGKNEKFEKKPKKNQKPMATANFKFGTGFFPLFFVFFRFFGLQPPNLPQKDL